MRELHKSILTRLLNQYYVFVLIGVAVVFQQYATWCGIGFTYDSYQYLAAAHSFSTNYTFLDAVGNPYTAFPPLFPIVLSFFVDNIAEAAPVLNGIFLAASLYVFYIIGKKTIESRAANILYFASLALGTPIILMHSFLWSEPFFLLLLAIKILLLYLFLETGKARFIFLLGIAGFLLCLQRNAGIFFIAGITIALLLFNSHRKKLYASYYICVSLSGFSLWNYYAALTTERILNPLSHPFLTGFLGNNLNYINVLGNWFLPLGTPPAFIVAFLIVLASACSYIVFRTYKSWPFLKIKKTMLIFIVVFVYLAGLFVISGPYPFESERLLAVAYPLAMLIIFSIFDVIRQASVFHKYYRLLLFAAVIWLLYPTVRTLKNVHQWHRVGCQSAPE